MFSYWNVNIEVANIWLFNVFDFFTYYPLEFVLSTHWVTMLLTPLIIHVPGTNCNLIAQKEDVLGYLYILIFF